MKEIIEDKINELLSFAERHGLSELSWQDDEMKVAFRRNLSSVKAAPPIPGEVPAGPIETDVIVKSPIVGSFRRAGSKDHPPIVMEGNHVKPGDRLGIVDCMKIPTDVVSFCQGRIKKIMVEDGQAVEYGQPLFVLVPDDAQTTEEEN